IEKQILPFNEVKECLKAVHAPYEPAMIGVSKERLIETFRCIPYMRSRISSVDLILRVGAFEECEKFIFSGKQYFK
ncbi:MAG: sn-glycerol-1-phosphate dehydrogenase, partial [Bacteroidales bacterium]|nr:sn-glycerol-1-phosphate dehydrogenase [Bacteroidales bacterium]